jgi:hypothetical protein
MYVIWVRLQSPQDTGECNTHTTEDACLAKRSMFDSSQSMCAWTDPSLLPDGAHPVYSCNYVQPETSWKVVNHARTSTVTIC